MMPNFQYKIGYVLLMACNRVWFQHVVENVEPFYIDLMICLCFISFMILQGSDPGFITEDNFNGSKDTENDLLIEEGNNDNINNNNDDDDDDDDGSGVVWNSVNPEEKLQCQRCDTSNGGLYVPLRSRHCKICDRCVATWDHHCHVIGTCIGEKNHFRFNVVLLLHSILIMMAEIKCINRLEESKKTDQDSIAMIMIVIIFGVILLFLSLLAIVHTVLMFTNSTTIEWIKADDLSYLRKRSNDGDGCLDGRFSSGFFLNILTFIYRDEITYQINNLLFFKNKDGNGEPLIWRPKRWNDVRRKDAMDRLFIEDPCSNRYYSCC